MGGLEERKILRMERYKHGLEVWGVLKTEGFEDVRIEYKLCDPPQLCKKFCLTCRMPNYFNIPF